MIRIFSFRKNDLNPTAGKQIEFNQKVVSSFFEFKTDEVEIYLTYKSLAATDPLNGTRIKNKLKLSPSRGDYKIYGNIDESENLKDFFLNSLHLNEENNLNDYFALDKKSYTDYDLYYLPASTDIKSFFSLLGKNNFDFSPVLETKGSDSKETIAKQVIFYGAPGTGKSHVVKQITEGKSKTVVTFHPDTDYSSFVGAYKPTLHENGEKITYGFVPQAFAKAYVNAWKNVHKDYYLVIEEINRGNCAQIFGDIFQLLDRNSEGYSDYVIDVDKDFEDYLKKELSDVSGYSEKIVALAKEAELDEDFSFAKIALPANFHIIATMNTSDQSLFPMDSAFKRRWDWQYLPIDYDKAKDVKIDIGGVLYNWGEFIETVNGKIKEINKLEDKQLGTFFVKAYEGVIPFEQFRSKVMFYLWFEIYKDEAGNVDCIFKRTEDDSDGFSFGDLFKSNAVDIIKDFMAFLKINPINSTETEGLGVGVEVKDTE